MVNGVAASLDLLRRRSPNKAMIRPSQSSLLLPLLEESKLNCSRKIGRSFEDQSTFIGLSLAFCHCTHWLSRSTDDSRSVSGFSHGFVTPCLSALHSSPVVLDLRCYALSLSVVVFPLPAVLVTCLAIYVRIFCFRRQSPDDLPPLFIFVLSSPFQIWMHIDGNAIT